MQFDELGRKDGKTLMLLPGTACDYQTNFGSVMDILAEKYHLICVNYDGFDGSSLVFPDILTVTEKIERYIQANYDGRIDGAIGSSGERNMLFRCWRQSMNLWRSAEMNKNLWDLYAPIYNNLRAD